MNQEQQIQHQQLQQQQNQHLQQNQIIQHLQVSPSPAQLNSNNNSILSGSNNIHVIVRSNNGAGNLSFLQDNLLSASATQRRCISDIKDSRQICLPTAAVGKNQESFTFDYVGSEDVSQEEIFQVVGKPIVDQCLHGYNGSIFAYGQTGSGKTFTIQGAASSSMSNANQIQNDGQSHGNTTPMSGKTIQDDVDMQTDQSLQLKIDRNNRGLLPRCFEYLFQQICKIKTQQQSRSSGKRSARQSLAAGISNLPKFDDNCQEIEFDVKCSYLEIYNECIIDLLDNTNNMKIQIREEKERGVYADPCIEERVQSIQDVMKLIEKGSRNRKIASTHMNRESSRSHAVFTAIIKTIQTLKSQEQIIKTARFHVVDLAGSERCKETGAEGQRLKEASMINKSLTTLGAVINDLADINCNGETKGKQKHIRYRESKLTYLLKDSLGGNSKTVMICNVNPHLYAFKETRQTLQFAQRAKMIKNQAVVNEENTSYKYWKDRYHREIAMLRSNTLPNPNTHDITDHNINKPQSKCINCKEGLNMGKLLLDAQKQIKNLTQQLQEEIDKRNLLVVTSNSTIEEAQKFKNSQKLNLKLKENQIKRLTELKQLNANDPNFNEIKVLQGQLDVLKQENEHLRTQVEENPLITMKLSHIKDLEQQIMILKKESNQSKLNSLLKDVLEHIDKSIKAIEQQNLQSKRLMQENSIDIEMVESNQNRSFNINYSQINDFSIMTVKRDQELANIKIQYEEQLETLRNQLKYENNKNEKLKNFISQKSTNNLVNDDQMLLNSSQNTAQFFNPQNNLLFSQRSFFNQSQLMPPQLEVPAQSQVTINGQDQQFVEEMQQLVNDCQQQLMEKQNQIELLESEIGNQQSIIEDVNGKYEQAMKDKIELETLRVQIEDQIQLFKQQVEELTQENGDLYNKIQEMEVLQEQNEELQSKLAYYENDNDNLRQSNEYFTTNVLPSLQQSYTSLEVQFAKLSQENEQLKQLKDQSEETEYLRKEISKLTALCNAKQTDIQSCTASLNQALTCIDQQKEYIINLQQKAKEDEEAVYRQRQIVEEYRAEVEKMRRQISELEQLLNESAVQLQLADQERNQFQQEQDQLKEEYHKDVKEREEQLRVIRSDRAQLENKCNYLEEQLETQRKQCQNYQNQMLEAQNKYGQYKEMLRSNQQQLEKASDSIKRFRYSQNEKTQEQSEQLAKQRREIQELKDMLREKTAQMASTEARLRALEQLRDKLTQKDTELQRLRGLERENIRQKGEIECLSVQSQQLESKYEILLSNFNQAQDRIKHFENMTEFNDKDKISYIQNLKSQNNSQIKKLSEQVEQLNINLQRHVRIIKDQIKLVINFSDELCQNLILNKSLLKVKCEENMKDFLANLLDLIINAYINKKPLNYIPDSQEEEEKNNSGQSESISCSSYEQSSIEDSRLKLMPDNNMFLKSTQQTQNQIQNRKIFLGSALGDNQENINISNQNSIIKPQFQQQMNNSSLNNNIMLIGFGSSTNQQNTAKPLNQFIPPSSIQKNNNNSQQPKRGNGNNQNQQINSNSSFCGNLFGSSSNIMQQKVNNNSNNRQGGAVSGKSGNNPREPSNQRMDIDN